MNDYDRWLARAFLTVFVGGMAAGYIMATINLALFAP